MACTWITNINMISATTKALVDNLIKQSKVYVASKSYCPYCTATKNLLKSLGISFEVQELDNISDGAEIQSYLAEITGQRTVPNVFINGKHIGGNSDLQALNSKNGLKALLA